MNSPDRAVNPEKIRWLIPMTFVINLLMIGVIVIYSQLNLRPFIQEHVPRSFDPARFISFGIGFLLPPILSFFYLRPVTDWLRRVWRTREEDTPVQVPHAILIRAANTPLYLGIFCIISWAILDTILFVRIFTSFYDLTLGMWAHFIIRPLLAGLIAASATTFAAEYICRSHLWPALFSNAAIEENVRILKIRVAHRLFLLWLVISFLPLSAVAMTAFIRLEALDAANDPPPHPGDGRHHLHRRLLCPRRGLDGLAGIPLDGPAPAPSGKSDGPPPER